MLESIAAVAGTCLGQSFRIDIIRAEAEIISNIRIILADRIICAVQDQRLDCAAYRFRQLVVADTESAY